MKKAIVPNHNVLFTEYLFNEIKIFHAKCCRHIICRYFLNIFTAM